MKCFDENGTEESVIVPSYIKLGQSCTNILTLVFLGSVLVIVAILRGFRRYRPGMPLVGSRSDMMSAACLEAPGDSDAARLPVQPGTVSHPI